MSLAITGLRRATLREWEAQHRACPWATFFHSPAWGAAWDDATHGEVAPDPHLVSFDDGRSAVLVLSWRRRVAGLVRTALSSPGETYGGWVSGDLLEPAHADLLARTLDELAGNLRWKLNPFDPHAPHLLRLGGQADETLVLDLGDGYETLRSRWTRGHRSGANKAQREGVSVRLGRQPADWAAYRDLVDDTRRRWGEGAEVIHYPPRLLESLARRGGDGVRLWLAEHDGRALAGAICLQSGAHVAYWHGAARADTLGLRPVNLLLQEVLRDACQSDGRRWFDFGSSGPLAGVAAFKRSFGAQPLACPSLRTETDLRRWARRSQAATRAVLGTMTAHEARR